MDNNPLPENLRELSWRRKLTPAEAARLRAWLGSHPQATADSELETALTEALGILPDAPVPSNFTARVLQAAALETAREQRPGRGRFWHWRPAWLLPRAAIVAAVLGVAVMSVEQIRSVREQTALANRLTSVPAVAEVPSPEVLQDYDAIRQMSNPTPDEQLLTLMEQ